MDVSAPSTNTVILTPSKITIEHNSGTGGGTGGAGAGASGSGAADSGTKHNAAYESSPIHWSYARTHADVSVSHTNDRTHSIEAFSEPETPCHSHLPNNKYTTKQPNCRRNNGNEWQTKQRPYADGTTSIWQHRHDHNDESAPRTIHFHHNSNLAERNCCDGSNAAERHDESDTDTASCGSAGCDSLCAGAWYKSMPLLGGAASGCHGPQFPPPKPKSFASCQTLLPPDQLNNAIPPAASTATTTSTMHARVLTNFRRNIFLPFDTHRFLDLSSDLRRYSKITNFEQQNASNLLPSHCAHTSTGNLSESSTSNGTPLYRRNNQNIWVSVVDGRRCVWFHSTGSPCPPGHECVQLCSCHFPLSLALEADNKQFYGR